MHRVIYDFRVRSDCTPEFEGLVADWFQIMKDRKGFIAISLFRSTETEDHFCAISDWASAQSYAEFHASPEHTRVAEATAQLFTTQSRNAYDLVYQVTLRDCGE